MPKLYKTIKNKSKSVNLVCPEDLINQIYKPKKEEAIRISKLFVSVLNQSFDDVNSRALKMFQCGDYITMATPYNKNTGDLILNKSKITHSNFCKDRFCPLCSYRLSRKVASNLMKCVLTLRDCGKRFLFLTLTLPNVPGRDLKDTIKLLNKGWSRFFHRRRVQCAFRGYFKDIEITYNPKDDTYHPHIHLLVDVNKSYFDSKDYISFELLQTLWTECNQELFDDYNSTHEYQIKSFVVDIRSVSDDDENYIHSVKELSKYLCKSSAVIETTLPVLYNSLYRVRSYEYIGDFRVCYQALGCNENIIDELDQNDDIEYLITHWSYNRELCTYIIKLL